MTSRKRAAAVVATETVLFSLIHIIGGGNFFRPDKHRHKHGTLGLLDCALEPGEDDGDGRMRASHKLEPGLWNLEKQKQKGDGLRVRP